MGTFHDDRGELHGITVVVSTRDSGTWVGRCDTVRDGNVVLLGADRHEVGDAAAPVDAWLRRIAMVGFHPRHDRVVVPAAEVTQVRRLADL